MFNFKGIILNSGVIAYCSDELQCLGIFFYELPIMTPDPSNYHLMAKSPIPLVKEVKIDGQRSYASHVSF